MNESNFETVSTFFSREYCICCEGDENFKDCPLCDDVRYFEDEYSYDLEDFMRDFYAETIMDPYWRRKNIEEKLQFLDDELEEYFQ